MIFNKWTKNKHLPKTKHGSKNLVELMIAYCFLNSLRKTQNLEIEHFL